MRRFPPNTAQLTRVKMSRTLYAQLVGQRFFPPKPFERAKWFEGVEKESVEWRRKDVGMKVVSFLFLSYGSVLSYHRSLITRRVVLKCCTKKRGIASKDQNRLPRSASPTQTRPLLFSQTDPSMFDRLKKIQWRQIQLSSAFWAT